MSRAGTEGDDEFRRSPVRLPSCQYGLSEVANPERHNHETPTHDPRRRRRSADRLHHRPEHARSGSRHGRLHPARVRVRRQRQARDGHVLDERPALNEVTISVPAGSGLTTQSAGECRRITASSKYDAPVGTLWTFTSGAVYCFKRNVKITYFAWESPDGHVTKAGQLAGWQYNGFNHSHRAIDACRHHGDSVGHFVQKYPVIGVIGRQDAPQHVTVSCTGSHPNWS